MPAPAPYTIRLREGESWSKTFDYAVDLGATTWSAAAAYAVGDVVEAFPAVRDQTIAAVDPSAARELFFRCTVAGTSSAIAQPTWPVAPGLTVVDGTVTWVAQIGTVIPVNLTGATGKLVVRPAPDSPDSIFEINAAPGIVLGGAAGTIAIAFTAADVAALISNIRYGDYDVLVTFLDGSTAHPFSGPLEIERMAAR